jgi:hypothetical protein
MYVIPPLSLYPNVLYIQCSHQGPSHLRDDVCLCRIEVNGQFIAGRCPSCLGTKQKCPLPSAIIHPVAIFFFSDTHHAPAQSTRIPVSIVIIPPVDISTSVPNSPKHVASISTDSMSLDTFMASDDNLSVPSPLDDDMPMPSPLDNDMYPPSTPNSSMPMPPLEYGIPKPPLDYGMPPDYPMPMPPPPDYPMSWPLPPDYPMSMPPPLDYRMPMPPLGYPMSRPLVDYGMSIPPPLAYRTPMPPHLDYGMTMSPPPLDYGVSMPPPLNNGTSMKSLDHCHPMEPHRPGRDVDGLMDDGISMSPHWNAKEVSSTALVSEHSSWPFQNSDEHYH